MNKKTTMSGFLFLLIVTSVNATILFTDYGGTNNTNCNGNWTVYNGNASDCKYTDAVKYNGQNSIKVTYTTGDRNAAIYNLDSVSFTNKTLWVSALMYEDGTSSGTHHEVNVGQYTIAHNHLHRDTIHNPNCPTYYKYTTPLGGPESCTSVAKLSTGSWVNMTFHFYNWTWVEYYINGTMVRNGSVQDIGSPRGLDLSHWDNNGGGLTPAYYNNIIVWTDETTSGGVDSSSQICTNSTTEINSSFPTNLKSGLVTYLDFSQTSGNFTDATGQGRNGTAGSAIGYDSSGKLGRGVNFTVAANNYVSLNQGIYNFDTTQSISFWIRTAQTSSANGFIFRDDSAGWDVFTISSTTPSCGGAGKFATSSWSGSTGGCTGTTNATYNDNAWHHVVYITNGNNNHSIWVDGILAASGTNTVGSGHGTNIKINIETQGFQGKIDEFGVWNRSLNTTEVLQLYNGGSGLSYNGTSNTTTTTCINGTTLRINDTRTGLLISGFSYNLTTNNASNTNLTGYCESTSCYYTQLFSKANITYTNISAGTYENTSILSNFNSTEIVTGQTYRSYIRLGTLSDAINSSSLSYTARVIDDGITTNYFINSTNSQNLYHTFGNIDVLFYNISGGLYFNVTFPTINNYNATTESLTATAYQSLLSINVKQLFTNDSIQEFNATVGINTNSTTTGNAVVIAKVGENLIKIDVAGNYSKNSTCSAEILTITTCNVTGIYDSLLTVGMNFAGSGIDSFSVNNYNYSLVNEQYTTTNGSIYVPLLRNYIYYLVGMPTDLYSIENTTLTMDNQTKFYNFTVSLGNTFNLFVLNETSQGRVNNTQIELISENFANNYSTETGIANVSLLIPGSYTIRYYNNNVVVRDYYTTLTNQSVQNISLYLIDEEISNYYVASIVDQSGIAVPNATIKLLRYYVTCNCYKTVEMTITDTNGRGILRVQPNIIPYKLIISKSGYTVTTEPTKFTESANTYTINLVGNPIESLQKIDSVQRSLTYNNDTQTYTFTWNDDNNLIEQACLQVDKFHNGEQTRVKDTCIAGSSGSIIYTITDTNNTRYEATGLLETNTEFSTYYENLEVNFVNDIVNFGYAGLLIAFVVILVIGIMALESGGVDTMILGTIIGIIGLSAIGLIYATWTMIVPIIILGIIAIYKTRV